MHLAIQDKVALVCGAGRAIALTAEGTTVVVTGRAQAYMLDLSQPEIFDEVLSSFHSCQ